jgi:pimeloyl-ACP methyl ester carboxylesterase
MDFRWPPPPEGRPDRYRPAINRGPQTGRPTLPEPPTELVATPHGVELECLSSGSGEPVTVFAHGLAGSMADTRPLGSGVAGRRIFFHFRGHGRSAVPPGRWTYADLARDLRAVADLHGGTRALGVSMGAAALCRLLADHPGRFQRLVFFLPAGLDRPRPAAARERLTALLDAVSEQDSAAISDVITDEVPVHARNTPAAWAYYRQRHDQLLRDGLGAGLADLPDQVPVADPSALGEVSAPALVIGCRGDDLHPPEVAERLAERLPSATLHVYDRPGVAWTYRADVRERIAGFLTA